MKPARLLTTLSALLLIPLALLASSDAQATVQRVTLVEEFGFFT